MQRIDPAAWLAAQDIAAYLNTVFSDDPLALGREALAAAGGDLLAACRRQEDLRAEIILAWLDGEIRRAPTQASELVRLAAEVVAEAG